ncbi:hypothetical protein L210DRAFT_3654499 [Boletus edulis BED1]|uniref:Uncharacterized protein n=1 Tax=Boletus edulis BED1 TaxID=1328754 RepID=A0AAD4BDW0_BOLED|nr:hypothetical protein L210DRAFT_3654499 [Boletus edulis BED1]
MVFLIKNKVASVEDVAHLSLSPAGRSLPQRSSNPADSVFLPFISSPHLTSAKPARSPEFSAEDEEWTDELEARMQNAIDRMLEGARRQLAEPVLNFS